MLRRLGDDQRQRAAGGVGARRRGQVDRLVGLGRRRSPRSRAARRRDRLAARRHAGRRTAASRRASAPAPGADRPRRRSERERAQLAARRGRAARSSPATSAASRGGLEPTGVARAARRDRRSPPARRTRPPAVRRPRRAPDHAGGRSRHPARAAARATTARSPAGPAPRRARSSPASRSMRCGSGRRPAGRRKRYSQHGRAGSRSSSRRPTRPGWRRAPPVGERHDAAGGDIEHRRSRPPCTNASRLPSGDHASSVIWPASAPTACAGRCRRG